MTTENLEPQVFENAANILALLANVNRLRMLHVMLDGKIGVGQLASAIGNIATPFSFHFLRPCGAGKNSADTALQHPGKPESHASALDKNC